MIVSIIVAMDERNTIGIAGGLPWYLSADLQNFKKITMGQPIIMGRKTHESIGRPLPGRENIIITRQSNYSSPGCTVFQSLESALAHCNDKDEVFIMGGAEIYREALHLANRLYLTRVHAEVDGDTWFPEVDLEQWQVISSDSFPADEKNDHPYTFLQLQRQD